MKHSKIAQLIQKIILTICILWLLLALIVALWGCTKTLVDEKPLVKNEVICKTCITRTDWYPEGYVTYDTCTVCGEDSIKALNGWGRTYAAPDLSWRIHKWTYCK